MTSHRVYELGRELGVSSREILDRCRELGIDVTTASSGLDETAVAALRRSFSARTPDVIDLTASDEGADLMATAHNREKHEAAMGAEPASIDDMPNPARESSEDEMAMPPKGDGSDDAMGTPIKDGDEQMTDSTDDDLADDMPAPPRGGDEMPGIDLEQTDKGSREEGGRVEAVLVELLAPSPDAARSMSLDAVEEGAGGFRIDPDYDPVPLGDTVPTEAQALSGDGGATMLVRGTIDPSRIPELEAQPNVVKVWKDTPIAPFTAPPREREADVEVQVSPTAGLGTCPIGTCDCSPGTAKGTMADVAAYLGVTDIWSRGYRGDGIVVGVVDGGITASGRPIDTDDTAHPQWPGKLIPQVIGGWPTTDWGTTGVDWGWHGNMCSTDVLGMAPNAEVYDIRISSTSLGGTISNAIAGYDWAINRHRSDGTPQILSNSWGIFQESWDTDYANDVNHPFTRKVVEALDEGILVLFAAGNCGGTCPDSRCGSDSGPGSSIWGANGHPRVITVGAVNKNEQFVGYSSQGPAALDPKKPDFCSITHFEGFFNSDSGTSAATPIAAGVVALLKQAESGITQDQVKDSIKTSAKDIGPTGWDQHSGAGILQALGAFNHVVRPNASSGPVVSWDANRIDAFVIGTNSALYHKWWNGSAWGPSVTGYEHMGGVIQGSPEVVAWGSNRLDVFVIGTNSGLYHKWWNGSVWGPSVTGYEYMGGQIQGQPKVVAWGPNRLDVFVIGTNSALYHKWWNGSAWGPSVTGYEYMGGVIQGSPEVVAWGSNRLDVFVVGLDSALYHKWWDGVAWRPSVTGYEYMGGRIQGQPKVVAWGPNRLDVFVTGMNSAVYHKWWNGSAWGPSVTGYEHMGGRIHGSPEVVAWGPNRLDLFVTGMNSAVYHKWWNGSAWGPSVTGYEHMGGRIRGEPRVVAWGPNRLDLFVTGMNSALYHKWWNGSAWGPSVTGYEYMGGVITDF